VKISDKLQAPAAPSM